ncbi:hypothetical protein KFU94_58335 [Chloroflexi bacterium TSY]|nr:hypothetical protein [Chloroflexi bacterium TSY]
MFFLQHHHIPTIRQQDFLQEGRKNRHTDQREGFFIQRLVTVIYRRVISRLGRSTTAAVDSESSVRQTTPQRKLVS